MISYQVAVEIGIYSFPVCLKFSSKIEGCEVFIMCGGQMAVYFES